MYNKFLYLLEELKDDFSANTLNDTISCFQNELSVDDLYKDIERSKVAINGQSNHFYDRLALDFVEDLNNYPLMYFLVWESIIGLFNESTKDYFYNSALELAIQSDATDYINGIIELEKDNPDIALFHFNRIEHLEACYFIGWCYLLIENYENSIKQNLQFLNYLDDILKNMGKELSNIEQHTEVLITKWNVLKDLAYSYSILYDFKNAYEIYQKAIQVFPIKSAYNILKQDIDEFIIFANNYIITLERLGRYDECLDVLSFLTEVYPDNFSYKDKYKKILEKKESGKQSDFAFNQLFKPKKPFGLDTFLETKLIAKEKSLEDMIVEQIKYGFKVFGRALEIYQDEEIFGRQYRIPEINGILDLLLIDKQTNQLYVVELKRNESGIEVVDQIENYINALTKQLNRNIKGIICLHKPNNKLIEAINDKGHIELYTYKFEFTKEK